MKACPFCAEDIRETAIKCKHCGEWLNKEIPSKPMDLPECSSDAAPNETPELTLEEIICDRLQAVTKNMKLTSKSALFESVISEVERVLVASTLEYAMGNQQKAAGVLGINRNTLKKKMMIYKIEFKKMRQFVDLFTDKQPLAE